MQSRRRIEEEYPNGQPDTPFPGDFSSNQPIQISGNPGVLKRTLRLNKQSASVEQRPEILIGSTTSQVIGHIIGEQRQAESKENNQPGLLNRSPLKELFEDDRSPPLTMMGDVNVMELRDGKTIDTPSKLSTTSSAALRNRRLLASHQRINADSSPFAHLQNQQPSDTPLPDRFPFDDDFNDDFDNYNNNDNNNVQPSANGRPPSRLAVVYPMISNAATPLNSRANRSIDTAIAQPSPNTERPFTRSMKRSLMKATSVAKQALMQATSPPKQRTSQEQRSVVRSNEQLFGHSGPRRNQPNVDDENDVFSDDSNNNNSHYNGNRLIGWVARLATRFGFEWDFLVVALIATGRLSMVPLRLVLSALFRIWFWFSFRLPKRIQSLIVVCLVCSIFGSLLYWRWNRSPLLLEIPNDFNGFITADEVLSLIERRIQQSTKQPNVDAIVNQHSAELRELREMIQSIASRHPSLTVSETNAAVTVSKDGADVNIHPNFVRYLMEFIESYKNEILAASVAASTNQRGEMSSSNQTEFIQNLVKQAVNEGTDRHTADFTRLIEEALDKYSADRIAKPDYALRTSGARIIRFGGLTSPPFGVSGRMINGSSAEETPPPSLIKRIRSYALALIGAIRLPPSKQPVPLSQPPDVVIASTEQQQPGKCWSFAGQRGLLTVMLASAVRPTEVTIEHVPKSVWPDVTLAPRRMQLWGVRFTAQMRQRLTDRRLFVSDDQQLLQFIYNAFASTISDNNPNNADNNNANVTAQLLGSFEYRVDGRSLQTFTLQSSFEEIDIVQLRVLDNYGHPERTCIYRMRVADFFHCMTVANSLPTGVRLKSSEEVGRALYAEQHHFRPGDIIFREHPLVSWQFGPHSRIRKQYHGAYQQLTQEAGADDLLACTLLRFLTIPTSYYERLQGLRHVRKIFSDINMTDFARPPAGKQHRLLDEYHRLVNYCFESLPEFHASLPPVDRNHCEWFIQSAYTNAHHCPQSAACGMFEVASKMAHACDPNCIFYISVNNDAVGDEDCNMQLTMVATRDIKPGEMLSCSYLSELDLIADTAYRRRRLEEIKFFECGCERCKAPATAEWVSAAKSGNYSNSSDETQSSMRRIHTTIADNNSGGAMLTDPQQLCLINQLTTEDSLRFLLLAASYQRMIDTGGPWVKFGRLKQRLLTTTFLFYRSLLTGSSNRVMLAGWICWGVGWIPVPPITKWLSFMPDIIPHPSRTIDGKTLSTPALIEFLRQSCTDDPSAMDWMDQCLVERMIGELSEAVWPWLKSYCRLGELLPGDWREDVKYLNSLRQKFKHFI